MGLLNKLTSFLDKFLYASVAVILIVTLLEIVFIGKNITFTTRFTPFESEENNLRHQTYITSAQAIIIFVSILYVFLLPVTTYSSMKQQKKTFLPVLLFTFGLNALLIFLNIYFLTGASAYRNYMTQQYWQMGNTGDCTNVKATLCTVAKCARMQVFYEARSMATAFTVINSLFSMAFAAISIMVNKRRKNSQKMELIV